MNKLDVIATLQQTENLSKANAARIVDLFFDEICGALAKGDRVEIRGLCSIYVKHYEAYTGRNPKTGELVRVKTKKLPFFKPGKELRERVDTEG
jgi:integration host factor subunit beta